MNKNNKIALVIFATIFFTFSAFNIFQPSRATVSEEEKRELARFPQFTYENLLNGKYFKGIEEFISDTFILRNDFINLSRKITSLWSANTFFNFGIDEIIFIPSKTPTTEVNANTPTQNIPPKEPENNKVPESGEGNQPKIEDSIDKPQQGKEKEDPVETVVPQHPTTTENSKDDNIVEPNPNDNLSEIEAPIGVGEPEFLSSGEIIYNGAVISIPYLVKSVATYYADVINYYQDLFPESKVHVICAPLSSSMVDDAKLKRKITDQNNMINAIYSYLDEEINGVNCFDNLFAHRNEYLYFKSDHHWTSRGAYYAYQSFAESSGLTPTPIESFKEIKMNDKWNGSMYYMTGDPRVKEIFDEVIRSVVSGIEK